MAANIDRPERRERRERRSFAGLQSEYEAALRDGKSWCARKAKEQAIALARRLGVREPLWTRSWP